MKYNKIIRICPECKHPFEAKGRTKYCSNKCRKQAQIDRQVDIDKTLCKQCKEWESANVLDIIDPAVFT